MHKIQTSTHSQIRTNEQTPKKDQNSKLIADLYINTLTYILKH